MLQWCCINCHMMEINVSLATFASHGTGVKAELFFNGCMFLYRQLYCTGYTFFFRSWKMVIMYQVLCWMGQMGLELQRWKFVPSIWVIPYRCSFTMMVLEGWMIQWVVNSGNKNSFVSKNIRTDWNWKECFSFWSVLMM